MDYGKSLFIEKRVQCKVCPKIVDTDQKGVLSDHLNELFEQGSIGIVDYPISSEEIHILEDTKGFHHDLGLKKEK